MVGIRMTEDLQYDIQKFMEKYDLPKRIAEESIIQRVLLALCLDKMGGTAEFTEKDAKALYARIENLGTHCDLTCEPGKYKAFLVYKDKAQKR